jgi:hypothetical protein
MQHRIPPRASRTQEYDPEDDDAFYPPRPRTSAVRYTQPRQQVIQRGNKRLVIHNEPPPARRLHWSFLLGLGMLTMLGLWAASAAVLNWWNSHQLDSAYGMPRTYQTDQVVGHADSTDHPTHFIAVNLNSRITIIEIPGGNSQHARIYSGPALYADNGNSIPVTLEFKDANGDGKVDMIVHVGDQSIVYLNDGTQFKPQQ